MSFTKIPRTLLNTSVSDSGDATAITIDSSENIGIGTTSPSAKLHVEVADNTEFLRATITGNESWAFKGASVAGTNTDTVSFGIAGGTQCMTWQEDGNVGIGVTNPGARLKLDNPSSFTNMIEYGNVAWNQNTGHGLVAVNRGSDGYVQLQITSNVDGSDTITVRSSDSGGSGAGLKHNLMADGKAVHSGGLLVGTTTQPTTAELDGTGQAGANSITIGDTTKLSPSIVMRSSATNGNWIGFYGNTPGELNTYNTDTNRTVEQRNPNGQVNLPWQPSFQATAPAATNGGGLTIVFGGAAHNTGSHYNTSNGRFTAPVAGKYLFTFSILLDPASATSYARILFAVNDSDSTSYGDTLSQYNSSSTSSYYSVSASVILNLAANDYVTLENHGTDPTYGTQYGAFCGQLLS